MKKFLCYDTNDAANGKVNVGANGVLKPNATVPSTNGAAYQQLVTDGDGNTKWEDRLAYEVRTMVLDHVVNKFTTQSSGLPNVNYNGTDKALTDDNIGDTYIVTINGVEYRTVLQKKYTQYWNTYYYLGADTPSLANNISGLEFPFSIYIHGTHDGKDTSSYFTLDKDTLPHTITVEKYTTKQIDEEYLPAATKYINITKNKVDGNVIYSADSTFADILQYIEMGKNVIVRFHGSIYQLVSVDNDSALFYLFDPIAVDGSPDGPVFGPVVYSCICIQNNDSIFVSAIESSEYYRAFCSEVPLVVNSSTSGSSKRFQITVDDSGTISATEVI